LAKNCPANPAARFSKNAPNVSPSPGGEGRGEDGRQPILVFGVPTDGLKPRQFFQFLHALFNVSTFGFCRAREAEAFAAK
jgi:hypothetical protein